MNSARKSIAVVMTCFNRREKTVGCVAALQVAARAVAERASYTLYLTDDGSTDGTAAAVRAIEPGARIPQGSGDLFWGGGMHRSFGAALADGHDFYLWLNDDFTLFPDGLARLLATYDDKGDAGEAIIVGAACGAGGATTYGGVSRVAKWKRTTFRRQPSAEIATRAESFNGNCVLIPAAVAATLGNIDPRFIHQMGDLDYGLRAAEAGIPVWVTPGHAGRCDNDHVQVGSVQGRAMPFAERWRRLTSKKGISPAVWAHFCRRHAGPAWPLFWAWPYVTLVRTSLTGSLNRALGRAS